METKFTTDYYIQKFEAIPEDQWCTNVYRNKEGQYCALGHCGLGNPHDKRKPLEHPEVAALVYLFQDAFAPRLRFSVSAVNDGLYVGFGHTPKQRILNVLYKIKEIQNV